VFESVVFSSDWKVLLSAFRDSYYIFLLNSSRRSRINFTASNDLAFIDQLLGRPDNQY